MSLIFEIFLCESITKLQGVLMQVVEIGKGSKVKYELDKTTGLIKVNFIATTFFVVSFAVKDGTLV